MNLFFRINFACFTLLALARCGSDSESLVEDSSTPVRPAKLLQVGYAEDYALLKYTAVVDVSESMTMAFQVGGQLFELLVNEVDEVNEGDVLARLDPREYQAQLDTARAQFEEAEAAYESAVRLSAEDAIAGNVLDQRRAQYNIRRAGLDIAEKALNDTRLIAPFAGVISDISLSLGETVQPGDSAISIIGRGGLEATVNLPSSIIANTNNSEAGENTEEEIFVTLEAAPNRRIPAVFKEALLEADEVSQTFAITFSFESPDDLSILPGMNASVWITDPKKASDINRISVPLTAVSIDGDEKYVYLVDPDSMTLSRRIIVIEDDASASLYVISGLESGETIVAAGVTYLSEGMQVRPWVSK